MDAPLPESGQEVLDMRALREKVLSDCPPHDAFWTCNGIVCRNLHELKNNIQGQNDWAFKYHVNKDHQKNDYANWIAETLHDKELAKRLQGIYDKERYVDIINERILELEGA